MFKSVLRTILGLSTVFLSLYLSIFVFEHLPIYGFVLHLPSAMLIFGLLIGISLMLVDFKDIARFFKFFFSYSASKRKEKSKISEERFEEMLNIYMNEGSQGLSRYVKEHDLPYIWQVVATKLEIKVPIHDIKNILNYKIRQVVARLDQDIAMMKQLSVLSPAVGMFGTVLGLIKLLANMNDFASLGPNMSLALVATLYGIFCANVVFVPLGRRVEQRKFMTIKDHENVMYWLTAVEDNKPSFYLKNKLRAITGTDS